MCINILLVLIWYWQIRPIIALTFFPRGVAVFRMAIHIFCYLTLKQYFSILNIMIGKKYCLSCLLSLSHLSLPSPTHIFLTPPFCFLTPLHTHTRCSLFLSLSFWTPLISWSPSQPYWASFPLSPLPSLLIFSVPLLHYPKNFHPVCHLSTV